MFSLHILLSRAPLFNQTEIYFSISELIFYAVHNFVPFKAPLTIWYSLIYLKLLSLEYPRKKSVSSRRRERRPNPCRFRCTDVALTTKDTLVLKKKKQWQLNPLKCIPSGLLSSHLHSYEISAPEKLLDVHFLKLQLSSQYYQMHLIYL